MFRSSTRRTASLRSCSERRRAVSASSNRAALLWSADSYIDGRLERSKVILKMKEPLALLYVLLRLGLQLMLLPVCPLCVRVRRGGMELPLLHPDVAVGGESVAPQQPRAALLPAPPHPAAAWSIHRVKADTVTISSNNNIILALSS